MLPWTEKYKPQSSKEVIGQEIAINQIKTNLKRPLLLYGSTGTGKTTIIYTLAKELNYEVIEINSSQTRNKDAITQIIGNAINQQSLFHQGKIVLIDDIDAISGTKDRGCLPALVSLISKSPYPVIFTCTNPWIDKLSTLRKKTQLIEFANLPKNKIMAKLQYIASQEKVEFDPADIQIIAEKSKGDIRAAINDLQTNIINNKLILEDNGERDKTEEITFCLQKVLQEKDIKVTNNIFSKTTLNTDEIFLWVDENLPKEYDSDELKKAYPLLSKADVFRGRIRRWQYWRFLVYIHSHLSAGIANAKKQNKNSSIKYTRTTRILKLWQAKMRNGKKLTISEKLADATHCSRKRALQDTFPYLKNILNNPEMISELNLGEDEISWLNK
ncbi:replication factor C large subunit [archaeon]|jgi:replication factor C large subunit|nr:replication factor C large subunit [archaeon]MBT4397661.1 replication factor C large subunit [archaeon]MBT4441643.1 replication factor C large subunit [archaeon]